MKKAGEVYGRKFGKLMERRRTKRGCSPIISLKDCLKKQGENKEDMVAKR